MIEEYVVGKIIEIREKENKPSRSIVKISVEGRIEESEHHTVYTKMFKPDTEVICVWRPEFKKITQMWFPCLWTKIAKQIEPYPTILVKKTNKKGKSFWHKVRTDLLEKRQNQKKPQEKVSEKPVEIQQKKSKPVLILY